MDVEAYVHDVNIESRMLQRLAHQHVIPAAVEYVPACPCVLLRHRWLPPLFNLLCSACIRHPLLTPVRECPEQANPPPAPQPATCCSLLQLGIKPTLPPHPLLPVAAVTPRYQLQLAGSAAMSSQGAGGSGVSRTLEKV